MVKWRHYSSRGMRIASGRNIPGRYYLYVSLHNHLVWYAEYHQVPRAHVVDGVLLVVFPRVLDLKSRQAVEGEPHVPKLEPVRHDGRK